MRSRRVGDLGWSDCIFNRVPRENGLAESLKCPRDCSNAELGHVVYTGENIAAEILGGGGCADSSFVRVTCR